MHIVVSVQEQVLSDPKFYDGNPGNFAFDGRSAMGGRPELWEVVDSTHIKIDIII